MSKVMSHETQEGQLVRNTKTGQVWTVVLDYPHKKVVESAKGTQVHVPPDFYEFWVEVSEVYDFVTGEQTYVQ